MNTISDIELSKTEFFVKIVLYKGYYVNSVVYYRRYMNIDFVLRWRWYFSYIKARLKVTRGFLRYLPPAMPAHPLWCSLSSHIVFTHPRAWRAGCSLHTERIPLTEGR